MRKSLILLMILALIVPVMFLGCEGDDGATGAAGAPGDPGDPGAPGPGALSNETCTFCHGDGKEWDVADEHDTATGTVTAVITSASFSPAGDNASVTFTFTAEDVNGNPVVVDLKEEDPENPVNLRYLRFTIGRLIPGVIYGTTGREPDSWDFYDPRSHRAVADLVDNGGGSYTFNFVNNVVLAPAEDGYTHRVGIEIYNLPSGLRSVNPTFDWVPDGVTPLLTREIVVTANCNECHNPLGYTPRFHGSRRVEIKHCVLCHNPNDGLAPQSVGGSNVPIPFVKLVHGIHGRAEEINGARPGQDLLIFEDGENVGDFTEVHIPQDIRNCTKCHKGGADSDNWKTRPTREACGSCHGIDIFDTGVGHGGGQQLTNTGCIICHQPDSGGVATPTSVAHRTENVTPNNQALPAGLSRFEYFIDNVAVDNTGVATVGFRITRDGAPFDLQTWEDGEGTTFTDRAPSFLLAWALTQDGIDAPAEYNNLNSPDLPSTTNGNGAGDAPSADMGDLWKAGAITGDSTGYTAVLSDPEWTTPGFPAGAKMRAVAIQSYFEQIIPDGDDPDTDPDEVGRHAPSVVKDVDPLDARRQVVKSGYTGDPAAGGQPFGCLECHETLELHGGSRVNNVRVCVFCHNPNKSSSGRTADPSEPSDVDDDEENPFLVLGADPLAWPEATNNFKEMIHGIHAATDRPYHFVRNRLNGIYYNWSHVTFPGDLMDCTKCHIGESYVPSNVPADTLWTTERTTTGNAAETRANIIGVRGTVPNDTDLVNSPISSACFYCHDDGTSVSHMLLQGGKLSYEGAPSPITREEAALLP